MTDKHWTAEPSALTEPHEDGWALFYNATPSGKMNADGSKSFSMIIPALLISEICGSPEALANQVADALNGAMEVEEKDARIAQLEHLLRAAGIEVPE